MLHIVLLEPEIPQNTGNVARTCAVTGASLHLIEPLGFSIEDRWLKRAGLDYWDQLSVYTYRDLQDFRARHPEARPWMLSSKGAHNYCDAPLGAEEDVWLMFGKETKGIPEAVLESDFDRTVRIPMRRGARCLNLSNAVAVAVYEALRQRNFAGFQCEGKLAHEQKAMEDSDVTAF